MHQEILLYCKDIVGIIALLRTAHIGKKLQSITSKNQRTLTTVTELIMAAP